MASENHLIFTDLLMEKKSSSYNSVGKQRDDKPAGNGGNTNDGGYIWVG